MSWISPYDGADHHLAHARRAGFHQQRFENGHAALHGIGGQQHFGHEQNAVAEIVPHDGHACDQRFGQNVIGRPAAFQQNADRFFDLFAHPVIKIVHHLLDKLVIGQVGEDDFFFVGHSGAPS